MQKLYTHHTDVFCQCFSPCGKFLVTGNNYGLVSLFSLSTALAPNADELSWLPYYSFKALDGEIYTLTSTDDYLISAGSSGIVTAWKWADIHKKAPKVVWSLTIPKGESFCDPEVNSVVVNQHDQEGSTELACGAGDSNVYVWDIDTGKLKMKLVGHTDYIHDVKTRNAGQQYVSGSEDGSVRLWDARCAQEAVHVIEPYKQEACARPKMGKFVSCVDVDSSGEWLVCGGGPSLSTWHLRSITPTATFNTPTCSQLHVQFYQDTIISAGTEPCVNHWYRNGDRQSRIPCTPGTVFNVAVNTQCGQLHVLTVAGSGPYVDVCTNFSYTALQLYHLYKL